MKYEATAILLAGGKSTRMGMDKRFLLINGRPLVYRLLDDLERRFTNIIVSANDREILAECHWPIVPDISPGLGPLQGIIAGLHRTTTNKNFVLACDLPCIEWPLVERCLHALQLATIAVPQLADGNLEPLFAAYAKDALPILEAADTRGEAAIHQIIESAPNVARIPIGQPIRNLNTPDDLQTLG